MVKNIFIFIIIVVLIIVGFYYFSKPTLAPTTETTTTTETATTNNPPVVDLNVTSEIPGVAVDNGPQIVLVTYTDSGFAPNTITIKKGDTVKFLNQSSRKMWVASDPHPTHTNYPEFDEKTAVANGGSYQFTFTKIGSWGYHNHFSSRDIGRIIVN